MLVKVKKARNSSFPRRAVKELNAAVSRWSATLSKDSPDLLRWAKGVAEDQDNYTAFLELICWHKVDAPDLISFLQELRIAHVPTREMRAKLRDFGKQWKEVEKLAAKACEESESYLGELKERALEIERTARLLSKSFLTPAANRPLEEDIAMCKQDIVAFLKRRKVREVNQYGWSLLRAVFGEKWRGGYGRDQPGTFRKIPPPFAGKVRTREDFETVMERAKLEMIAEAEKRAKARVLPE